MRIIIPSYKRADKQITIGNLSPNLLKKTTIVVQAKEEAIYRSKNLPCQIYVLPEHIDTIGPTREHILQMLDEPCIMMDDDLKFKAFDRKQKKYNKATHEDVEKMVAWLTKKMMEGFAHASIGYPMLGRNQGKVLYNSRYYALAAYNAPLIKALGGTFIVSKKDKMLTQEDFHLALQLLCKGYPSIIATRWLFDTKSNAAGGCSETRTFEQLKKQSKHLSRVHKGFVSVVKKDTDWGEHKERYDVRVNWKKAFISSPVKHWPEGHPK